MGSASGAWVRCRPLLVRRSPTRLWGRTMFEYVDCWLSSQTEATGVLAGHVQVFDLNGLGIWQISSSALVEKLKIALGAGGKYVEVVSHIYVINSSTIFSMAWTVI